MAGRDLSDDLFDAQPKKVVGGRNLADDLFPAEKKQYSIAERAMAVPAGINRGFWADLPGIPVDAVANVIDLGKAGIGTAAGAIGKLVGADPRTVEKYMPDITPRGEIVGSGEWIANKLNKGSQAITGTRAFENPNPDDAASRVLFSGGRVMGGSVLPNPRAAIGATQQAMNMGMGAAGGLLAGGAMEALPNGVGSASPTELAIIASMLPQLAKSGGQAATQKIVRGNEQGRQAMEQRIQDLKNAGVDNPSAGLASGNSFVMGLENILSHTPGSGGLFQSSKDQMLSGIQGRTNEIRNQVSPNYGAMEAGTAIQNNLKGGFKNRLNDTEAALYGRLDQLMPSGSRAPVTNTAATLEGLTSGIPGAPNLGQRFINGRISDINDAFRLDTGLVNPAGPLRTYQITSPATPGAPPVQALPGQPGASAVQPRPATTVSKTINPYYPQSGEGNWKPPSTPMLPYEIMKKLRTEVGGELNNNSLVSDTPRSQWKQLYASLSQDMRNAADQTSPQASQAFNRANDYSRRGANRLEDLDALANAATPEKAYGSVAQSLQSGPTIWNKLRGTLSPEARGQVVATIIDDLGKANPGQQNAAGDAWSPKTFLSNYNKIEPKTQQEMFKRLPGGEQHAKNLQEIAKATEMISNASKIWSNPSGTAPALTARATLGTIGAGVLGGAFYAPLVAPAAAAAGGLVAANGMSRLLLNPQFVSWLAKAPNIKPQDQQAYALRMLANSRFSPDKQYQEDVQQYLSEVANAQNQQE